ncbi:MAG: hypothetical protein LR015_00375 [Verrucomicrobia bacterium]|nr:hypothetical protein [Verrucomicrobiota bacterium]
MTSGRAIKPAFFIGVCTLLAACGTDSGSTSHESVVPEPSHSVAQETSQPPNSPSEPAQPPAPAMSYDFTVRYTAPSGGHQLKILDQQPYGDQWWILAEVIPPPADMMTTMALEDLVIELKTPVPPAQVRVFLVARRLGFGDQDHVLLPSAEVFYEALRTPQLH